MNSPEIGQFGKSHKGPDKLSNALGWFSIGLGLTQILAPRMLSRMIGVRCRPSTMAIVGLREISSGIGILSGRKLPESLWSRVIGDAMDLWLLASAALRPDSNREKLETAAGAVTAVAVLDLICARQHSGLASSSRPTIIHAVRSVTINRPQEDLYSFWRDFRNLPRFMRHLESVEIKDPQVSHWKARTSGGFNFEWDAAIISDSPNERIAWRSLPGAELENSGSVDFEATPAGRGTVVRVEIEYRPPGGALGAAIARLLGESPEQQLQRDLYRLRQLMETGRIPTTEGQPSGRGGSISRIYDALSRR